VWNLRVSDFGSGSRVEHVIPERVRKGDPVSTITHLHSEGV
jgi:hypothetical protein